PEEASGSASTASAAAGTHPAAATDAVPVARRMKVAAKPAVGPEAGTAHAAAGTPAGAATPGTKPIPGARRPRGGGGRGAGARGPGRRAAGGQEDRHEAPAAGPGGAEPAPPRRAPLPDRPRAGDDPVTAGLVHLQRDVERLLRQQRRPARTLQHGDVHGQAE